jgi:hypothetical protein
MWKLSNFHIRVSSSFHTTVLGDKAQGDMRKRKKFATPPSDGVAR